MIIYIASDHAGYACKNMIIDYLWSREISLNDEVIDLGPETNESCDYPDYANKLCAEIMKSGDENAIGILVCGTGIGMSIAANRHSHIRCALSYTTSAAEMARLHNNANVLAISGSGSCITEIVSTFINTSFSEEERHIRRIQKLNL
jgi:ribose 5-phosphate isomerase B